MKKLRICVFVSTVIVLLGVIILVLFGGQTTVSNELDCKRFNQSQIVEIKSTIAGLTQLEEEPKFGKIYQIESKSKLLSHIS